MGKEREGPRDGGGGGWLRSGCSAAPAARPLAHSLAAPAARRPLRCLTAALLARRSGVAQAPEDRTQRLAGRAQGGRGSR